MRWEEKPSVDWGTERIIKKFLYFPLKIGKEIRWWEYATIKQSRSIFSWVNIEFINEKTK